MLKESINEILYFYGFRKSTTTLHSTAWFLAGNLDTAIRYANGTNYLQFIKLGRVIYNKSTENIVPELLICYIEEFLDDVRTS